MKFYQEISLINENNQVWSRLYQRLHGGLCEMQHAHNIKHIGVCFPQYHIATVDGDIVGTLGSKLRIFAPDEASLKLLDLPKRLSGLKDDVHISSVKVVPADIKSYVVVSRYRYKTIEAKANAYAVLKRISYDEAFDHVSKFCQKPLNYPFVTLKSGSNGSVYPLPIKQQPSEVAVDGEFNNFGINNGGQGITVPYW